MKHYLVVNCIFLISIGDLIIQMSTANYLVIWIFIVDATIQVMSQLWIFHDTRKCLCSWIKCCCCITICNFCLKKCCKIKTRQKKDQPSQQTR